MYKKLTKLTKKTQKLLDDFDEAAQEFGWSTVEGTREQKIHDSKFHGSLYIALYERLFYLENMSRKFNKMKKNSLQ